jgi:poly(3-hydroxybutyrate) depolymerase
VRDYQVMIPTNYDPHKPIAVTFVFHGAGGTSASAEAFGLQAAVGAADSSIFVFPQGIPYQTYGVGWDDSCGGYDMVFFDNMLHDLSSSYCIDTRRVFAAGFSWGCDHVTALACCRGNQIRAIGAASCTDEFADPADYHTYQNLACPVANTARIRFTHDTNSDGAYTQQMFSTTSQLYRSFNACSAAPPRRHGACVTYRGCTHATVECSYPGLGHALPPNWAEQTEKFFRHAGSNR